MKKVLQEKCFADMEEVKQKMAEAINVIKSDELKNCFEQWKKHLNSYIASNGEFFEGEWRSLSM